MISDITREMWGKSRQELRELEITVRELKVSLETLQMERARLEAAAKPKEAKQEVSPLLLATVGGIITGVFAILNSYSQARQAHQLEEDKLRSTLILKAIEPSDPEERKRALQFYVDVGLLSDPGGFIAKAKPEQIPQAPETSRASFVGGATYQNIEGKAVIRSGLVVTADGSPHAYHPPDKPGLDTLANVGHPGHWFGLITDSNGEAIVQKEGDPAPGYYVSITSLQDASQPREDPRRYVDSETIAYITLPGNILAETGQPKLGDLAAVYNERNGKLAFAIVADIGPKKRLGEGSIALAQALGVSPNVQTGGVESGIATVVFPGSGDQKPKTRKEIDETGARFFASWGGLSHLKERLSALSARPN